MPVETRDGYFCEVTWGAVSFGKRRRKEDLEREGRREGEGGEEEGEGGGG
jgi:hypothetical protein